MSKHNVGMSLGILGVGHLATYSVQGLRKSGDQRDIYLSPRNSDRAQHLAQIHQCQVMESNQAVVDQADIVLLAVRPAQLTELLADIEIPDTKVVISAVAGVSIEQLRQMGRLPVSLARMLPTVCSENAKGIVPVFPAFEPVLEIADQLGTAIALKEESEFELATTMACLNGWLYPFMGAQLDWLIDKGLAEQEARLLVADNIQGAAAYLAGRPAQSADALTAEIATEGTYTKLGLDQLRDAGAMAAWQSAMDMVYGKLTQGEP